MMFEKKQVVAIVSIVLICFLTGTSMHDLNKNIITT